VNDWTLEPFKFGDEPSPPPGAGAPPSPPPPPEEPEPEPERPFRADLKQRKARRWGWVWKTLAVLFVIGVIGAGAGAGYIWFKYLRDTPDLPPRDSLFAINRAPGIKFYDRGGVLISSRGPRYGERVTLKGLPAYVPEAFLAAEDKRFYKHGAVDFYGIARAAWANWRAGHVVQGGSTLTQQLAKGMFLTPNQTIKRKLQEALMAVRLSKVMSRDEILELYLNRIFFGANTFGIDGASRTYFGKPASQLSISEAALLASLPKAPSRMALTHGMTQALARSRLILANMRQEGWITAEQEQAAYLDVPKLTPDAVKDEGDFGYILDYATTEAVKIVGPNAPDLVVRLTIDPRLQHAGANTVRQVLASDGKRGGATQASLLTLGTDGSIRAMVGGTDFDETPFNRAVQAKRQPGSTFKPFVYAAALEKGVLPTDVIVDGPVQFGSWKPENYGGGYRGPVTVETALINSINTVAVKLADKAGGDAIGDLARRFGFTSIPSRPDLSVALGAYEVNLLELVSGFQVFQQGGQRLAPYMIDAISTTDGKALYAHTVSPPGQVYDVTRASMMVKMMKKVVEQGTAKRAAFGRPAAGKTGTSQNWRDAWFIGFTADYVTGVWVGNDDDRPMNHVVGGDLPAQIWRRFMIIAHDGLAIRDFDWLLPDPALQLEADPRNGFYGTLAAEFAKAAQEEAPGAAAPDAPDADKPKNPTPETLPY
jgi:penicillin-binding protein 1A